MLRVKFVKLSKNIEETSTSSTNKFEEKFHRLQESKNEEKVKSYTKLLNRRNHGEQESKRKDTFSRRPSTFKQQRIFNYDYDQPSHDFRMTTSQRGSSTLRYQSVFYCYYFYCTNFRHKVVYYREYGRNVQSSSAYVAPCNIECYKFHNYCHIA
jgi:hypothetical protein